MMISLNEKSNPGESFQKIEESTTVAINIVNNSNVIFMEFI